MRLSLVTVMLLLPLSPVSAQPFTGHAQFAEPGHFQFVWPDGVLAVQVKLHGSGASGGSSFWVQLGGGGGSGAYIECLTPRPAIGVTDVRVDPGGAGVPAGSGLPGNPGGDTHFGSNCGAWGAGGGQQATGPSIGGDGGTPGIAYGSDYYFWIPGGAGGASAPAGSVNYDMPAGAPAPMGGAGGNNGQSGMWPGGGGAPGNSQIPSGPGARGQIDLYW